MNDAASFLVSVLILTALVGLGILSAWWWVDNHPLVAKLLLAFGFFSSLVRTIIRWLEA